ncbi:hypothetical protein sos41_11130 [Alphaproteobacteria bacterium SO-S41]|nr:hypothetical protein sos41_11130 [Alphaproteobacteria bacterium SO-S41]
MIRLFIAALAALFLTAPAAADTLMDCNSGGYKYTYCPADTRYGVELEKQNSSAPCILDQSWGYDGGGVWTDTGCRGTFRILSGRGGKGPPPPPQPYEEDGDDIIAPGIIAGLQDEDDDDRREPGYGRADALRACALYASDEEANRGAQSIYVDSVEDVVPRGRRSYDVTFTLTVQRSRGRVREYTAECTVERGGVTSYARY